MAIWIPDLSGRKGPKYLQIVDVMAEDIVEGRLAAGTRLPPHRELAYQLGLSPNTTSRAYAEAVRRALLRGEVGRGTFVRSQSAPDEAAPETLLRPDAGPVDLSRNLPLPGLAERHIKRALEKVTGGPGLAALLDYQTNADLSLHREAGRQWLAACGLNPVLDGIVPTVGGQHGIFAVLMAMLEPGDLLLAEALTYTPVLAMAARLSLKVGSVALDSEGIIPDAFEDWCRKAKPEAFYLTPTLQAPTTVTLSAERRRRIAEIAARHGVLLIEDDVFGPLEEDKPAPLGVLAPDNTVYVSSLSKSVSPGLRVGFLSAPARIAPALRQSINLSVWMAPPMMLEVAGHLIFDGTASALMRQQRKVAKRRQSIVRGSLSGHLGTSNENGYHLWVELPSGWRADVFSAECAKQGVLVSEGRSFALNAQDAPEAVRLCVSHEPSEERVRRGIETIAGILGQKPSSSSLVI